MAVYTLSTACCAVPAYVAMFLGFRSYDDEGYMLISLKEYLVHGGLYDKVFSQYGPFFYQLMGGLFTVLRLPVAHDTGRLVTLTIWLLTCLILGLAIVKLSGSLVAGVGTQVLSFYLLFSLTNEPMHPGGLLCLLLASMVAASLLFKDHPRRAMFVLGLLVAAASLVKVNVGLLAALSIVFAASATFPVIVGRKALRLGIGALFIISPFLLIGADLRFNWFQRYALLVAMSALGLAISTSRLPTIQARGVRELAALALGGIALVAAVVGIATLLAGTTLPGLLEGVLLLPALDHHDFELPVFFSAFTVLSGLVGLSSAFLYQRLSNAGHYVGLLKLGAGLWICVTMAGFGIPGPAFASALGVAWVAALPPTDDPQPARDTGFTRLLLPSLAVLQALHAYPVAGSQVAWSGLLLVPVGALCIADGASWLHRSLLQTPSRWFGGTTTRMAGVAVVAALLGLCVVNPLVDSRRASASAVALRLPGTDRISVSPDQAATYQWLATEINSNCSSFISLPGMNSLYFFTGQAPPTLLNMTHWMTLFDAQMQQHIVAQVEPIDRLCVVKNQAELDNWVRQAPHPPGGPLLTYITDDFVTLESRGGFALLVRERHG